MNILIFSLLGLYAMFTLALGVVVGAFILLWLSKKWKLSHATFKTSLFIILIVSVVGVVFLAGNDALALHTTARIDDGFPGVQDSGALDLISQEVTATTATITWKTFEPSPTWLQYGITIAFGGEYKDENEKKEHRVTLRDLEPGKTYQYTVWVKDSKGLRRYHQRMEGMKMINYYSSPSFTTLTRAQEEEEARKQAEAAASGKSLLTFRFYGDAIERAPFFYPIFKDTTTFDFSAPRITSMTLRGNSSQAELLWTTERDMSESYIGYGPDTSHGFWRHSGCTENCTSHTAILDGLVPGQEIHFKIRMRGRYNEEKTSSGYSVIETPDLSFVVPLLSSQTVNIPLRQSDITAPAITDIRSAKVAGENRRASLFFDIPKRGEITVTSDEPAQATVELLHIKGGAYSIGDVVKTETISSSGFNTTTTLSFEPLLDAERDYAYQVTVQDAAGNRHTSRYFALNVRGSMQETSQMIGALPSFSQSAPQTSQSQMGVTTQQSPTVLGKKLLGRILLQVQGSGEAWYVHPKTAQRHYLGRPSDALRVMREQGVGVSNADLSRIARSGDANSGDGAFAKKQAGRILLQVQSHGEAWYVNPLDAKRYYLGRPSDALAIMRTLGIGISNADLAAISL
ncbi:fibronectin type III domain-containing protein [Candidatus Uhrbacteria bacterium]|nr:fibronectin type III domain-containing protein [Candidatus Uhrbacteria bacterium]